MLVIDLHRHPERQRREALPFTLRDAAQRRVLDEDRQIPHLQIADVEPIDPRELQAAQADFADARAQRVGDRADVGALRRLARDDRFLGAGVEDEVLRRPPFTFAWTTILSSTSRNGIVCSVSRSSLIDIDGRRVPRTPSGTSPATASTPPCRCGPCSAAG